MALMLADIRARLVAVRDDLLVWIGVGLLAVAVSQIHVAIAVALVGLALITDGLLGGRRR